jgi:hypothetical protein
MALILLQAPATLNQRVAGGKCHPCVRYDLSPMSRVAQNKGQIGAAAGAKTPEEIGGAAIPSAVGGCYRPEQGPSATHFCAQVYGRRLLGASLQSVLPRFRPSLHAGLCGMYLSRGTTSTRVSATTEIHRERPRSRCRPNCHETPVPRATPTTSRPRKRSRIARHGTNVKCSSRWITANLPLASMMERR